MLQRPADEGVPSRLIPGEADAACLRSVIPARLYVLLAVAGARRDPAPVLRLRRYEWKCEVVRFGPMQPTDLQMDAQNGLGVVGRWRPLGLAAVLVFLQTAAVASGDSDGALLQL